MSDRQKTAISFQQLCDLAKVARRNGTQDAFVDLALDWAEQAALAAAPPPAPAVPEGWQLVPTTATPEMIAAYLSANSRYWQEVDATPSPVVWRNGTPREATAESYRAMLAAAPGRGLGERASTDEKNSDVHQAVPTNAVAPGVRGRS